LNRRNVGVVTVIDTFIRPESCASGGTYGWSPSGPTTYSPLYNPSSKVKKLREPVSEAFHPPRRRNIALPDSWPSYASGNEKLSYCQMRVGPKKNVMFSSRAPGLP
jgi:hypothetical protein